MSSILVTGGAGYIGSHLCMALVEKGYKVYSIDSFINSQRKIFEIINSKYGLNSIFYLESDIRYINQIEDIFKLASSHGTPIKSVIHCAGLKSVSESFINPIKYWDFNVLGSINLFKVMEEFNCENIVFSSSATVYGNEYDYPIKEEFERNPISVYGKTKLTVENILSNLFYSKNNNWKIAILRYFNPIGSHKSGLLGESAKNNNNLFPKICDVAAGKRSILEIYGCDWPTFDGTPIRDYIHIMDLIDAHIKSLELLIKEKSQILNLNLGSGKGTSVIELIRSFEGANNIKINFTYKKRRNGDVPFLSASIKKAKKIINWEPKRSLNQMCEDGWKWYLKNLS